MTATNKSAQSTAQEQGQASAIGKGRGSLIALMFLLSGASGLIYEVVWSRQLTTLFGSTVYAISTVLTAFMGGLALGSWLLGKRADRMDRPLMFYGFLELGIAIAALAFPFLLRIVTPIIGTFYSPGGEAAFVFFSLVRFVIAVVLLLIPTTLMGATLPVISRAVTHDLHAVGKKVGGLYALNTTGAVIGVFVTGFFLIERFGVHGTTLIAAAINVFVTILAVGLGRSLLVKPVEETETQPAPEINSGDSLEIPDSVVRIVLGTYLVSGLVALAFQVSWTRSLIFNFETLKATTYSFAGMLTVFLLGLAIGSAIMQAFVDRLRDHLFVYVLIQFGIGVTGALSIFIINAPTPSFLFLPELDPAKEGALNWWAAVGNVMIKTALSLGLPTLLMGMAFPIVARIAVGSLRRLGRDVGQVYALNTLGAIIGSFLGGFVLIPLLGITLTLTILSGISLLIGVTVLAVHPKVSRKQRPAIIIVSLLVIAFVIGRVGISAMDIKYQQLTVGESMAYYHEGPLATVSVIEDARGWRTIYVDDVGVAGTDPVLQTDQKTLAHAPMLLLGGEATRVATVGFGAGGASWSYTLYPDIKEIHAIEITTSVLEAAPSLTDANHGILYKTDIIEDALEKVGPEGHITGAVHPVGDYTIEPAPGFRSFDPRYRVVVDDARAYFRFTGTVYDVIATDCTDLRYKTNANLYDQEYFELCREHITDDGLVVVWMPLGGLSDEAFRIVVRTFHEVFPEMTVWYFTNQPTHYCLFIGQKGGLKIDYSKVLKGLELPAIQADLEEIGLRDPNKLIASFVTDERGIDHYVGDGPLNTADFPIIEFLSPRYGYDSRPVAMNMGNLYKIQVPAWDLIVPGSVPNPDETKRLIGETQRANEVLFQGHAEYRLHNLMEAARLYRQAKEIAPHDKSIDRLLEFEELRQLLSEELERDSDGIDHLWINAQWIAFNVGQIYEEQGKYSEAVTVLMPFVRRTPQPSPNLDDDLAQIGSALNLVVARCYAASGNRDRAKEFLDEAEAYEPKARDWEKMRSEILK
ncbi:fused MFS/spermidine synthase [bacterium]|nr:fused MFS/spermidine synthase [bacterium]